MAQTAQAAYYAMARASAKARAAEDPSLVPHGILSGYSYWGCRCDACTTANRERWREWNAGRKARRQGGAA